MKPRKLGEFEIGKKVVEVFWIPAENAEKKMREIEGFEEIGRAERIFDIGTKERDMVEKLFMEIIGEREVEGDRVLVIIQQEFGSAPLEEGERGWLHKKIRAIAGEWK